MKKSEKDLCMKDFVLALNRYTVEAQIHCHITSE